MMSCWYNERDLTAAAVAAARHFQKETDFNTEARLYFQLVVSSLPLNVRISSMLFTVFPGEYQTLLLTHVKSSSSPGPGPGSVRPEYYYSTYRLRLASHSWGITAVLHKQNNWALIPAAVNQHSSHGRTNHSVNGRKSTKRVRLRVCVCVRVHAYACPRQ